VIESVWDPTIAATYPERTLALVIHGSYPSAKWEPEAPCGLREDEFADWLGEIEHGWGTEEFVRQQFPSLNTAMADDPRLVRWVAAFMRRAASPGAAVSVELMEHDTDVRHVLSAIHVPTLILHRAEDDPEANRYMAEHIPGAEYVALPGQEHVPYLGDQGSVLDEIERFVKGVRDEEASLDRVLATVLFTDIVGSTEKAAELGDRRWRALLEVRAGLHTGEGETIDGKVGGIAVVIGARVGALAGASEVLVSQTVKDLVAGSGLAFDDGGEQELKGVPDRWRLYRVVG
jgi:class 3 adenylate cyclase